MPINTEVLRPFYRRLGAIPPIRYGIYLMDQDVRVKQLTLVSGVSDRKRLQRTLELHAHKQFGDQWALRTGHAHILDGFPKAYETSGNRVVMVDVIG